MKWTSVVRQHYNRLALYLSKRTGIAEDRAFQLLRLGMATLFVIALAAGSHALLNTQIASPEVSKVGVDRLVNRLGDIRAIDVYGTGQDAERVELYTQWKDGRTTVSSLPRATYANLESSVLVPKGVEVAFKEDTERPGAYPALERARSAMLQITRDGSLLISILLLLMIMRTMGFAGGSRYTVIQPKTIEGDVDDLVGMEDIKAEVLMLADLYKKRDVFRSHGIQRAWNVLFSGPAGVGKTKFASYLAKTLDVPMLFIDGSRLEDGFVGGGSRTLQKLHKKASSYGRCIVFIDEGQSLLMRRGTDKRARWEDDTPNTLLSLLDGVRTTADAEVIWIIASNFDQHTSAMDEAVLRRFQLKVNFRLPNLSERTAMLERFMTRRHSSVRVEDLDFGMIAEATAGLSPAHLEIVVDQASLIAIREGRPVDGELLMRALERTVLGLTDRAQTHQREKEREVVATHETGHFLAGVLRYADQGLTLEEAKLRSDIIKISTESLSSLGALGFAMNSQSEVKLFSEDDLEWKLRGLYGGRAAEEVVYGKRQITTGAKNDIERASEMLVTMVSECGFHQASPVNLTRYRGGDGQPVISAQEEAVVLDVSARLYRDTCERLQASLPALLRIRDQLLERYTLDRNELFELLAEDWPGGRSGVTVEPANAESAWTGADAELKDAVARAA